MLDIRQIESFYPENQRIFKRNLLREYLQYKILGIMFSSRYAEKFTFIGGTALRILFQHSLFSEYIDFDIMGIPNKNEFMEMVNL